MRLARAFAVAAALFATSLFADSDSTYTALRASRPDGRTIALSSFTFDKDVLHITLTGTLHLLTPVDGKTPGAVFVGQGTYELTPATKVDLRSLQLNSGDDKLTRLADKFETAVFFGPELVKAAGEPKAGSADPRANGVWDEWMKKQRKDLQSNEQIRVLRTLLNVEKDPYFFAWLKGGTKYGPALLRIDPLGVDASGEETRLLILDQTK